jgi:hypothetical protein
VEGEQTFTALSRCMHDQFLRRIVKWRAWTTSRQWEYSPQDSAKLVRQEGEVSMAQYEEEAKEGFTIEC